MNVNLTQSEVRLALVGAAKMIERIEAELREDPDDEELVRICGEWKRLRDKIEKQYNDGSWDEQ